MEYSRSAMRGPTRKLEAALVLATFVLAAGDAGSLEATAARPAAPAAVDTSDPDSGSELIGRSAPDWGFDRWIRTRPLSLESLRGKVVLLRWWTEGCRFCANTLPTLEQVRRAHEGELVVIGVYHPKPPRQVSDRHVLSLARRLGFQGPIAVDSRWSMLERYWLNADPDRSWTSVSFLIDREGIIRWVHGGGEYHPSSDPRHARCSVEYAGLERALTAALAEHPDRSAEAKVRP